MLIGVFEFCGIFCVLWDNIYYWFILKFWGWMGWDWVLWVGWGLWDGRRVWCWDLLEVGGWRLGILVLDIILDLEDFLRFSVMF